MRYTYMVVYIRNCFPFLMLKHKVAIHTHTYRFYTNIGYQFSLDLGKSFLERIPRSYSKCTFNIIKTKQIISCRILPQRRQSAFLAQLEVPPIVKESSSCPHFINTWYYINIYSVFNSILDFFVNLLPRFSSCAYNSHFSGSEKLIFFLLLIQNQSITY